MVTFRAAVATDSVPLFRLALRYFRNKSLQGGVLVRSMLFLLALACLPDLARGYSILTHEQIIDISWKDEITPVLLKRFPGASEKELQAAHAYAYGGCLVQDMGYYPLGNEFFSDLTHYVRGGDFVANLISESTNLNEYAFGLGALAHYCSDNSGHPFVNQAVALSFPKLRDKFGNQVTYEKDPKAHLRVEFGFDMAQVSKNRYTARQYHDFIGFEVSKPLLERAFQKTYGLPLNEVLHPVDLSIGTFRRAASTLIPELTKVALEIQQTKLVSEKPGPEQHLFLYHLSRSEYEKEWGKDYRKPGFIAKLFAFALKWVPKAGPMKALAFKIPSTETEELYVKSINQSLVDYRTRLRAIGKGKIALPNFDFDTGQKSRAGEYGLSDTTYLKLLDRLSRHGVEQIQPDLRQNILVYFSQPPKINAQSSRQRKAWEKALAELETLKQKNANNAIRPGPSGATSSSAASPNP